MHAVSRRDFELFQAILTLADSALNDHWRVVEDDAADVVLVSFDAAQTSEVWEPFTQKYPTERLIAYTWENTGLSAKWHIRRVPDSIPRLSEVVTVLNNVTHHFKARSAGPASPPETVPAAAAPGFFTPREYLTGLIQSVREEGEAVACALAEAPPVFLSPRENAVYADADTKALSSLCRQALDGIRVRRLTEEELRGEVAARGLRRRRTLSEFLWFSVLAGSGGRLLEGHTLEAPVYLREWPGYVRLAYYSLYHELATHMASGAASVEAIAVALDLPIQTVVDFHNACAFFGLLARGEEARRLADEKIRVRDELRHRLQGFRRGSGHLKVVLAGPVGVGKTTAVTVLSETPPILTEANPSDSVAERKPTTTVAMEYGEVQIGPGCKLQIYGTPGQRRFDFMGKILCGKAWGLIILIDNRDPDPLAELDYYISLYTRELPGLEVAVGISHYAAGQPLAVEDYRRHLQARGLSYPVALLDTRDIHSLADILSGLGNSA
jgi:signal recognition particle receptor subunit beta